MPLPLTDRIEINPAVMLGKPVIRGTRILLELIIRKLSEGATEADLLDAYPRVRGGTWLWAWRLVVTSQLSLSINEVRPRSSRPILRPIGK